MIFRLPESLDKKVITMSDNKTTPPPLPKKNPTTPPQIHKQNNTTHINQTLTETPQKSGKAIAITLAVLVSLAILVVGAIFIKKIFSIKDVVIENDNEVQSEEVGLTFKKETASEETLPQPATDIKLGKVPFTTTVVLNIRQCANVSCESAGIIPKSSTVYPILNDDGKWSYQSDTDTTGWIRFYYQGKLCHPENYNKDQGECSSWSDNQTASGWLHSSGVIFNININELVNIKDSRPLSVAKDTNIRQCASTSCEVIGVMPKETPMNILYVDNQTPAAWNNWFAVEYQGKFCYPDNINQQSGCNKWTENQKIRGFIHRSTINFEFNPNKPSDNENNYTNKNDEFNNLF